MALAAAVAVASEGVVKVESDFSVKETSERLKGVLEKKGMTLFKQVSHSGGAEKVGIDLRETELVIFGNPKVGTPLMQCEQLVALDLPQKALIYEDEKQSVWVAYNDPKYLQKRYNIKGCDKVIVKIEKALGGIVKAAAQK